MTSMIPHPPAQPPLPALDPADIPNLDNVVIEDGVPIENIFVEKQYRLLTEPLYSSWPGPGEGRPFVVMTNVGYFHTVNEPPLVPDCLLSLDVRPGKNLDRKENNSYFQWIFGKQPDVVIEIVSDKRGGEEDFKKDTYARLGVPFYVIYDPRDLLQGGVLRTWGLVRRRYAAVEPRWFAEIGLGLILWDGAYERWERTWLRWCDQAGRVIPTGAEQLSEATRKIERLEAQLRDLGQKPEG